MTIEEANAELAGLRGAEPENQNTETITIEEANAKLRGAEPANQDRAENMSIEEANAALGVKPELGIFERMALEQKAKTGNEASVLDFLPVIGGMRNAEQNQQEAAEQKLYSGDYRDTLEASKWAHTAGLSWDEIKRINGLGDEAAVRKGFSDAVKDRFAARIKTREEAQRKLQGAEEAGTVEKIVSGTITGGATVLEFANPVTMAAGTAGKIINGIGDKGKDVYTLDENGNPVIAKDEKGKELRGDRSERAAAGVIASKYAEQIIWTSLGLKQLGGLGVKILDKIPGVSGLVAKGVGKVAGAAEGAIRKIASTEGGRLALETGKIIGKVNDTLHFGSLLDMMYKSHLTELTDVLMTSAPEERKANFKQWLDKFTSIKGNAEMLTGIIGIHLLTAGYGALRARGNINAYRHLDANGQKGGREEFVAEYIGKDAAKRLDNTDLENIYTLLTSPELSEGKINEFLQKIDADAKAAKEKIDGGESVASVIEGIREKMNAGSEGVKTAAERIRETLENKKTLTPEMEDALDGKIQQYTRDLGTAGEPVAKMVKDDILANVKDNAVYEQPEMLDELVAMSLRKFNSEGRRLRIHDVRGEKNTGAQLRTINELGITSWEQAETEGLVTKDKYGRYGGGARRALNIALHGSERLQAAVRDGKISGETAERLLTASQCELGARPVEEQTALVDGILERAKGDEALARRMLDKLEAGTEALQHEKLGETLDRLVEDAKADAIAERNGVAKETAQGAAVEPVETADGQIKTVGEIVDADSSATKEFEEFQRKLVEQTHANGGITASEFQDAINAVPVNIRKEMDNDPALKGLLDKRNEIYRKMGKDGGHTEENQIALDRAQKAVVDAMNAFVKNRPADVRAKEIDARDGTQLSGVVALADSIAKGNVRGRGTQQHFKLAKSNDILKANGLTGEYFTIKTSVITSHYGKDADHSLTPADWANVCEALQDPLVISKYRGKGNAYRIWVETQINGHYAVVGVEVKSPGKDMTVNAVKTVFGDAKVDIKNDQIIYSRKNGEGLRTLLGEPNSPEYSETPRVENSIANSVANVKSEPKPTTALGGAEQADRLAGTKLTVFNGTTMSCETFPEAKVEVSADGITVRGLTADTMAKPDQVADVAAFVTHLMRIAKRNGKTVQFEDADAATIAQALVKEIAEKGAEKTMAKLETRGRLFGLLFKTTLGSGVTYDEASFKKALEKVGNGRQFVNNHGDVYGFVDAEGVIHFNPATFNMDTPIHEYGHVALEAMKKINNALWRKGNELIKKSRYYRELLAEIERDENSPYRNFNEEWLCDEALARLIGDEGAKLVESKGLDAQLKSWLKEVWKSFKGALGIADLTEEQIEKMTIREFADTLNAELLKGSEFGAKKKTPPSQKSIRRYVEQTDSGSSGVLRWKNDRGYLFAIPVDMERTQPGGKVVFATDDANITDWIQNALNGYTLRLSKSGKLYVEGRDGLPPELAEIFGRYPTIGQNDGIYEELSPEARGVRYDSPEALVDALRKDRENYDAWVQGRAEKDAEAQHYADQQERESFQRWEDSGMSVLDYIRSRVEEGDPDFDLDWETARELEREAAEVPFSVRRGGSAAERERAKFAAGDRAKDGAAQNERPYVKFSAARKNKAKESKSFLSDTAASAEVSALIRRSVAPVLDSLTSVGSVANLPPKVKGMVDGISSVVESIASGKKVKGTGAPVSVKNLITTLRIAGFNRATEGGGSAYLMLKGRSIRISDHSADAWRFKRDNNLSVKLKVGRGDKPFNADAKKNVIEVTYGKGYLEQNPAAFAGMLRDMAEFAATGEFHDTVGAAKVEFSGETEYRNRALRTLVEDAHMRGDTETADKLNAELPESMRVNDQTQNLGKMSVGRLYTGSAADYEKPSLLKVGTGEGSQVYGWGLYASSERGVAEKYAEVAKSGVWKNDRFVDLELDQNGLEATAARTIIKNGGLDQAIKYLKRRNTGGAILKELQEHGKEYRFPNGEYIYEQTFFTNRAPGDESHLLKWYEPVSKENAKRIADEYRKEFGRDIRSDTPSGSLTPDDFGSRSEYEQAIRESWSEVLSDGEGIYKYLSKVLGSEQAASEFLARADIDGIKYPVDSYGGKTVKDGDKAGWNYVSFRDDNINMDHKWVDGQAKFSVGADQTQTRQFKEWFGKSKTVDADGKPLLMYRGAAFDPLKQPNGEGVIKPEAYFTTDPNYAKRYAGSEGTVRAYYLKIEHPFDIRDPECQKDFAKIYPGVKLARGKSGALDWAEASTVDAEFLNENFPGKYDGIIYDEASDWAMEGNLPKWRGLSYVPLNGGAQVKSATDNIGTFDPANPDVRFSTGNRGGNAAEPDLAFDPAMIVYNPKLKAMGETEQNRGGIAAGIEKKEALRPWTRKGSPCDLAKPIAMDCADMVQLFRAVSGSTRNPIIRKGDHIPGRPNAIGLNRGGSQIELANRLFGMVDASDVGKLKADCTTEGYFRNENPDWCAAQTKDTVQKEAQRSRDELDRRTRELIRHRVATGEGGMHYATQVLGHEIGHTIAMLPRDKNLGSVGNAMRTLFDSMQREMKRALDPLRRNRGETNLTEEVDKLITGWHGAETLPNYFKKPQEKFAELFGIFLTQPEYVHTEAPKAYDALVKMMGQNEKLALAYRRINEAKWNGTSNKRVMAELEKTWKKEQQDQFRKLNQLAREPISKARDWFNYALNDRFGPMFAISMRSLKAEKKLLKQAVKEGAMSAEEAAERIRTREAEINALKTSLFDWQRQTGGATRLMMADLDDVIRTAERDGVNWESVRTYAHLNRVIELGGRATAHGIDPSRAAAMLGDMARELGAENWTKVEKTWKAYRAVYERHVLEDAKVREMFGEDVMKFLDSNKHYVTMKHRMSAEESAEWMARIEEYRAKNKNAWDPTIDLWERMNRGLKGQSGVNAGFKLHTLEGSFEATEDPIAATMMTALSLKENAARNHLLKTMSQTLRDCGVKGVYDTALEKGAKEHAVDPGVYERLTYMDGGVKHELIVPLVIGKSFTTKRALPRAVDFFGGTMRFLRNTMTLWNPAFINRAYLVGLTSFGIELQTDLKEVFVRFVPLYPRVRFDEWVSGALYKAGDVVYRSASKQCYTAMRDVDDESATIVPGSDDDEIWQEFEISDIFEPYLTKLAAADLLTESQGKFQTQARADAEFEILCERYHEGNGESKIRRGRFI